MLCSQNLTCEIPLSFFTESKCAFLFLIASTLDSRLILLVSYRLTGVLEVGIFAGMAEAAYFGYPNGQVQVRWQDGE